MSTNHRSRPTKLRVMLYFKDLGKIFTNENDYKEALELGWKEAPERMLKKEYPKKVAKETN